jgi:hypothetical protein
MIKFNDEENVRLDKLIKNNRNEINRRIKDCENYIKEINNQAIRSRTETKSKIY